MRKLGVNLTTCFGTTIPQTIQLVKKTGFDTCFTGWDIGVDVKSIKSCADSFGLEIETLHAPFIGINPLWDPDSNEGDYYVEKLKKCIWDAGENSIPYVVMHTTIGSKVPFTSRMGLTRIEKLVIEAKKSNVKLAFENLEFPRFMFLILDYFKDENVGFCYDIGHEYCYTPGLEFLPQLNDRLFCTHIHDNFGLGKEKNVDYRDDYHRIPFDCDIDFEKVCKKLKNSGYTGSLMLEVGNREDYNYYGELSANEFFEKAFLAAKKLRALTDGE